MRPAPPEARRVYYCAYIYPNWSFFKIQQQKLFQLIVVTEWVLWRTLRGRRVWSIIVLMFLRIDHFLNIEQYKLLQRIVVAEWVLWRTLRGRRPAPPEACLVYYCAYIYPNFSFFNMQQQKLFQWFVVTEWVLCKTTLKTKHGCWDWRFLVYL